MPSPRSRIEVASGAPDRTDRRLVRSGLGIGAEVYAPRSSEADCVLGRRYTHRGRKKRTGDWGGGIRAAVVRSGPGIGVEVHAPRS